MLNEYNCSCHVLPKLPCVHAHSWMLGSMDNQWKLESLAILLGSTSLGTGTLYNHNVQNYYIIYYRVFLGLLNTADGDKIVEDPIIESFYKVDS